MYKSYKALVVVMESRRERKRELTRIALLEAAMALFAERGIYGTRVEDITERIDLGKGAFYNYFPSKDALVADLVAEGVRTFGDHYLSQLDEAGDLAARAGALARLHARFLDDHPEYALLFHQARGLLLLEGSRVEKLRAVFADFLAGLGDALARGSEGWTAGARTDLAAALVGAVSGYRSFVVAAGVEEGPRTVEAFVGAGIPAALEASA